MNELPPGYEKPRKPRWPLSSRDIAGQPSRRMRTWVQFNGTSLHRMLCLPWNFSTLPLRLTARFSVFIRTISRVVSFAYFFVSCYEYIESWTGNIWTLILWTFIFWRGREEWDNPDPQSIYCNECVLKYTLLFYYYCLTDFWTGWGKFNY